MPTEHIEFPIADAAREQTQAAIERYVVQRQENLTALAATAIKEAIAARGWNTSVKLATGVVGEREAAEIVANLFKDSGYRVSMLWTSLGHPDRLVIGWEAHHAD